MPNTTVQVSPLRALWGLSLVVSALIAIPLIIRLLWVRNRLVVAKDRLQLIERDSNVIFQVLYANIAKIKIVQLWTNGKKLICINLKEVDDVNTYGVQWLGKKRRQSWHVSIDGPFVEKIEAVYDRIQDRFKRFKAAQAEPEVEVDSGD
jgi:hypothetical protein